MASKSATWLLFLAVVILFSTGPLFWLTFSVFFSEPSEYGSNDSAQTIMGSTFNSRKNVGVESEEQLERLFKLRRNSRRKGDCRNGWLNGYLCHGQNKEDGANANEFLMELDVANTAKFEHMQERASAAQLEIPADNQSLAPKSPQIGRKLRIAQIAPLSESIPPKFYGGTERIVYYLTEELVRQGHHVTLFCSNDSITSAQEHVSHESWPALRLNPVVMDIIPMMWMMEQVKRRAHEFDILHFHGIEYFPILHPFVGRTVTTMHGIMSIKDYETLFQVYNDVPLVSISDDQRVPYDSAKPKYVSTVHHGIPAHMFPFKAVPSPEIVSKNANGTVTISGGQPYLAFLGRITEVKRPEWAIEIAVRAGIPLKIAAKVDRVDVQFWEESVKPLVEKHSDLVEYIGEINDSEKPEFLGNALALLFPIDWSEPFGLVMIESMACGTPVVARPHGSVPEVIEDGLSGLIFDTIDEGVEAVKKVHTLDRAQVRQAFERRFSSEKMAQNYVKVYENLLLNTVDSKEKSEL